MLANKCVLFVIGPVIIMVAVTAYAGDLCKQSGIVKMEFIFDKAPFEQCHASTIVETKKGQVAAWFGGKHESNPDVGIWLSRKVWGKWTKPTEVANGVQYNKKRYPCWNPVLFQPKVGALLLFYKAGPSPDSWWGMLMTSNDCGKTWSTPRRLPEDIFGPIKNKPIQLPDGVVLCGSSTENKGWRVHFERTADLGGPGSMSAPSTMVKNSVPSSRHCLSLIHISEPTRRYAISYAVFCLKKNYWSITTQPMAGRHSTWRYQKTARFGRPLLCWRTNRENIRTLRLSRPPTVRFILPTPGSDGR